MSKKEILKDFSSLTEEQAIEAVAASHAAYSSKRVLARYLADALESSGYIHYTKDASCVIPETTTGFRKLIKDPRFNMSFASREELIEFLACMGKVYKLSTSFAKALMALLTAGVEKREIETCESKTLECETLEIETRESVFLLDTGAFLGRFEHWIEMSERGGVVFVTQCAAHEVASLAKGENLEVVKASRYLAEHPERVLPNPEKVLVTNIQELINSRSTTTTKSPGNVFRVEQIIQTAWSLRNLCSDQNIFVLISNYIEFEVAELIINSAQQYSAKPTIFVEKNYSFLVSGKE